MINDTLIVFRIIDQIILNTLNHFYYVLYLQGGMRII